MEDESWAAGEVDIQNAIRFCETMLQDSDVTVPEAVVVDVGEIRERGWSSNATRGSSGPDDWPLQAAREDWRGWLRLRPMS
jgi:hypothetical protein